VLKPPDNLMNTSASWGVELDGSTRAVSGALVKAVREFFRRSMRLPWLGFELTVAFFCYIFQSRMVSGAGFVERRAKWLHRSARRISRVFGMTIDPVGPLPSEGILVANHLSYLDVILIGAITSARFISKSEVSSWPVFGFFARCAGTIFVDRARRNDTARANQELEAALADGQLTVLFPEGTSTGGTHVLPFKSSLLEPVTHAQQPITVAHISYSLAEGSVTDEVAYWRDMTLVPHLWNLLGKRNLRARIAFSRIKTRCNDRKELAKQLHREVLRLSENQWNAARGLASNGRQNDIPSFSSVTEEQKLVTSTARL
jgi:1-acyl-sn-glycerol-3-phosphate acyltransferase